MNLDNTGEPLAGLTAELLTHPNPKLKINYAVPALPQGRSADP